MSMEVDHVIAESLLSKEGRLAEVLRLLGRSKQFQVNSFENWLPSCRGCNGEKRNAVFDPSPVIQLQRQAAQQRANKAREFASQSVSNKEITKALNVLLRARKSGELTDDTKNALGPLILFQQDNRPTETVGTPVRLTPLYTV
jgi:excinuclease UvrABC ATPase subunit